MRRSPRSPACAPSRWRCPAGSPSTGTGSPTPPSGPPWTRPATPSSGPEQVVSVTTERGTAVPVPRSVVTLTTCSGPVDGVACLGHGGPDGGVGEPVPVDGERAGQRHLDGAHAGDLGDLLIDRRDAVPARHPGDLIDLFGHDLLLTLARITLWGYLSLA